MVSEALESLVAVRAAVSRLEGVLAGVKEGQQPVTGRQALAAAKQRLRVIQGELERMVVTVEQYVRRSPLPPAPSQGERGEEGRAAPGRKVGPREVKHDG